MDWIISSVRKMRQSTTVNENMRTVSTIMPQSTDITPTVQILSLPDPNEKKRRRRHDEYHAPTPPRKRYQRPASNPPRLDLRE